MFRVIGFVSLTTILVLGIWPVLRAPIALHGTVSQTWTVPRNRRRWFSWALSVAGLGTGAGIAGWLIPHFGLSPLLYVITVLACAAMQLVAWVPLHDLPGEHSWRHGHFIGGAALATLAALALGLLAFVPSRIPPAVAVVSAVAAGIAASWPVWYVSHLKRYFLLAEITTAGLFSLVVLWLFLAE